MATCVAPSVCPSRRAVPSIPLAPPLRLDGAEEMMVLLLGVWNKPKPDPQMNSRHIISILVGLGREYCEQKKSYSKYCHADASQYSGMDTFY